MQRRPIAHTASMMRARWTAHRPPLRRARAIPEDGGASEVLKSLPAFGNANDDGDAARVREMVQSGSVDVLEAILLAGRQVVGSTEDVGELLEDVRGICKRLVSRAPEMAAKAKGGMGHEVVEAVNNAVMQRVDIKREVDELQVLDHWLLHRLPETGAASHMLCAAIALDALARLCVPSEAVSFSGAPHHVMIRTRVMGDEAPGLETVLDVGYPWFFAADAPRNAVAMGGEELVYRVVDAMRVVAMASGRYREALEACRVLAYAFPSMDVVRDVGICMVQDEGCSTQEGIRFLQSYVSHASETERKSLEFEEAERLLRNLLS